MGAGFVAPTFSMVVYKAPGAPFATVVGANRIVIDPFLSTGLRASGFFFGELIKAELGPMEGVQDFGLE